MVRVPLRLNQLRALPGEQEPVDFPEADVLVPSHYHAVPRRTSGPKLCD